MRCFYNTCPHRGAEVCREERGNAKRFTCFYHAWTFDTSGSLLTMPDEEGYGEGFKETCSLTTVPKLDSYRGFWFISFNHRAEPLHDYLDGAKEYLDLVVDQAEEGMRILPGTNEYAVKANWKLMVENSLDGYHGLPLHQTYFAYVKSLGGGISGTNLVGEGGRELGHGHVVLEGEAPYGRPIARWDHLFGEDSQDEIAAIRARLVDAYGEDREPDGRQLPQSDHLSQPDDQRHHCDHSPLRRTAGCESHAGQGLGARAPRGDRAAPAAPDRQLPHLHRAWRVRQPRRRGGARVLPGRLSGPSERAVERHLAGHDPHADSDRRGPGTGVLAGMGSTYGRPADPAAGRMA